MNTEDLKKIGEHLRPIMKEASKEAFKEQMVDLGIDADKPLEMQTDMRFLRKIRISCENMGGSVLKFLVLSFGTIAVVFYALGEFLMKTKGK